jgi:hypothetical protein
MCNYRCTCDSMTNVSVVEESSLLGHEAVSIVYIYRRLGEDYFLHLHSKMGLLRTIHSTDVFATLHQGTRSYFRTLHQYVTLILERGGGRRQVWLETIYIKITCSYFVFPTGDQTENVLWIHSVILPIHTVDTAVNFQGTKLIRIILEDPVRTAQ